MESSLSFELVPNILRNLYTGQKDPQKWRENDGHTYQTHPIHSTHPNLPTYLSQPTHPIHPNLPSSTQPTQLTKITLTHSVTQDTYLWPLRQLFRVMRTPSLSFGRSRFGPNWKPLGLAISISTPTNHKKGKHWILFLEVGPNFPYRHSETGKTPLIWPLPLKIDGEDLSFETVKTYFKRPWQIKKIHKMVQAAPRPSRNDE